MSCLKEVCEDIDTTPYHTTPQHTTPMARTFFCRTFPFPTMKLEGLVCVSQFLQDQYNHHPWNPASFQQLETCPVRIRKTC